MIEIKLKSMSDMFYDQVDPRRRQEIHDARMIQEDQRAMANLSERPIYRIYNNDKFKHDCMKASTPRNIFNDEVY